MRRLWRQLQGRHEYGKSTTNNHKHLGNQDANAAKHCLCIYDFDHTLTADVHGCPKYTHSPQKRNRYQLSEAGAALDKTQCGNCFSAVISAGPERDYASMVNFPRPLPLKPVFQRSRVPAQHKAQLLPEIIEYYKGHVDTDRIFFFDDFDGAVQSFKALAPSVYVHQVSRRSRNPYNPQRGRCGATRDEISTRKKNIFRSLVS
jgi:hypothetical protein